MKKPIKPWKRILKEHILDMMLGGLITFSIISLLHLEIKPETISYMTGMFGAFGSFISIFKRIFTINGDK